MAGLTVDQLSASVDARLDNNSQNLLLWSGSFQTKLDELGIDGINAFSGAISTSLTNLSSSVSATSTSFNARINSSNSNQTTLSASVSDDVTNLNLIIDSLNDFSASITSSFNSLSASVSSTSASFSTRINTLRLDAGGVSTADFNALTQSLSGVISSSAQLNNATITNLTITNLTTINETASVVFSSGSNQFGDNLADNHILSGSVYIVGSGSLNGYTLLTSNNTSSFLTSLDGALSSSAQVLNGSGIFSSSAQLPSGLVSASSQVLVSSGIFSSSAQLPSGLVSASSQLPSGLVSASSQILDGSGIFSSSAQLPAGLISSSINTGSFATTGSNVFRGDQTLTGSLYLSSSYYAISSPAGQAISIGDASIYTKKDGYNNGFIIIEGQEARLKATGVVLETNGNGVEIIGNTIITGSTLSVKKSTDSDPFFVVDGDSKRLALVQGNGEIPGEFYLALSGSSAFSPRPLKTMLYGAKGIILRAGQPGAQHEMSGSLLMSGSIIPAVGSGETTSSFSLGSATNAWKDLWVSNGTINFLGADGTPQGTLSSTANGLQLGSSTISGSMVVTGSLTIVNALGNGQKVLSADGILGANYIAGNSAYNGVTSGFTSSIQPIISSYFNNYFSTVNSSPYKYQMGDLGIGTTYSYNNSTFTPAPAINVGYNPDLSFYTGSSSNIYSPGFSTIISSNNNLSGLERNEAVAYSNGINHVLAVTGSLLSRDNTTLGTKATDLTYIRGVATISGSLMISGSLTVSSSAAVDVNVIGKMNVTGSLEVSSSNTLTWYTPKLDIYNPDASDVCSFQLNKYSTSLGGYYNFTIRNNGDAGNGVWLTNGSQPLKIMTDDVITLGANNGATGSVKVIGSMTLAAQTVPTGTLAAGMMYFDSGTNQFLGYNGTTWVVLG
jgi:trimeric autotransporter adhesin